MVCSELGPLNDLCKQLVGQFVPRYLQQLGKMIDAKQVCGILGMCTQDMMLYMDFIRYPVTGDFECTMCKTLVDRAREMDRDPAIQADVKNFVENSLCGLIGNATECKALVETYAPMLFELLASELDGTVLCETFGLCKKDTPVSRLGLLSAPKVKVVETAKPIAGPSCAICEFFIHELENQLGDNRTQEAIVAALERVCDFLPKTVSGECKSFVLIYGKLILNLLVNDLPPKEVCSELGVCTAVVAKPVDAGPGCEICEFALTILDSFISANSSEAEVEIAMKKICGIMPVSIREECKEFVDQYGPAIINIVVNKLDPKQVCKTLRLCTSSKHDAVVAKPVTDARTCEICKLALTFLDSIISKNSSEAEVEAAMKKICNIMPETIREECKQFVDQYGPAVINLVVKKLDPKEVCKTLRICTSAKSVTAPIVTMAKSVKLSASPECIVCEFLIKELGTLLKDNATEEVIENALDKVCNLLPGTVRQQCIDIVQTYGPAIIELLIQEADPEVICTTLGLCTGTVAAPSALKVSGPPMCEICMSALTAADALLKKNATVEEILHVLENICSELPVAMRSQCKAFVDEYTSLLVLEVATNLDPKKTCIAIRLCDSATADKVVLNEGLLGRKQCTYGPAYWCASMDNAIKCNTVHHCKKHVWN